MGSRAGRRLWKILRIRELLRKMSGDPREVAELGNRDGFENDLIPVLFDQDLGTFEAKGLRQANSLAPAVLEDFCSIHSYGI